jgi:hypothetical protein
MMKEKVKKKKHEMKGNQASVCIPLSSVIYVIFNVSLFSVFISVCSVSSLKLVALYISCKNVNNICHRLL